MIDCILHLVNYGWPHIDGYTVRTSGLVTAQHRDLGLDTRVTTGPFAAFARAGDPDFSTDAWHDGQLTVGRTTGWERPGLGLAPISRASTADELVGIAKATDAQLIHVHHPHYLAAPARLAADRLGIPMVYELRCFNGDYDLDRRNPYFSRIRGPLFNRHEYRQARAADAVVTISDGLADRLTGEGGVDDVTIVRNSVDTTVFVPGQSSTARSEDRVVVGYATTFEPIESLDVLIDALAIARSTLRAELDLHAVIAGTGRDADRIRAHRDAVADAAWLDLPGFVPFSTMPAFLDALDVFVVPRGDAAVVQHTTPLKPLEALACGVPVVSTDLPALHELFGDHPAVRFTGTDAASMAEGIVAEARARRRADPADLDRAWRTEVEKYRPIYERLS